LKIGKLKKLNKILLIVPFFKLVIILSIQTIEHCKIFLEQTINHLYIVIHREKIKKNKKE